MALDVGAAINAGGHGPGAVSGSSRHRIGVKNSIVIIHQLVIPRVSLEVLITVGNVPGALFASLAEDQATPVTVVVGGCPRVVNEFAGDLDGEPALVKREGVQRVRNAAVGDDGIVIIGQNVAVEEGDDAGVALIDILAVVNWSRLTMSNAATPSELESFGVHFAPQMNCAPYMKGSCVDNFSSSNTNAAPVNASEWWSLIL